MKQKYSIDTKKYHTLQAIVQDEVNEKVTHVKNSATDALMWLRRGVWFLREFLYEFSTNTELDMAECVHRAYQITLKPYHNWVVKSIFSLTMRSLPSKKDFLKELAVSGDDFTNNQIVFEKQVCEDMKLTIKGIDNCLNLIKEFYLKHNLDV